MSLDDVIAATAAALAADAGKIPVGTKPGTFEAMHQLKSASQRRLQVTPSRGKPGGPPPGAKPIGDKNLIAELRLQAIEGKGPDLPSASRASAPSLASRDARAVRLTREAELERREAEARAARVAAQQQREAFAAAEADRRKAAEEAARPITVSDTGGHNGPGASSRKLEVASSAAQYFTNWSVEESGGGDRAAAPARQRRSSVTMWKKAITKVKEGNKKGWGGYFSRRRSQELSQEHIAAASGLVHDDDSVSLPIYLRNKAFGRAAAKVGVELDELKDLPLQFFRFKVNSPVPVDEPHAVAAFDAYQAGRVKKLALILSEMDLMADEAVLERQRQANIKRKVASAFADVVKREGSVVRTAVGRRSKYEMVLLKENENIARSHAEAAGNLEAKMRRLQKIEDDKERRAYELRREGDQKRAQIARYQSEALQQEALRIASIQHQLDLKEERTKYVLDNRNSGLEARREAKRVKAERANAIRDQILAEQEAERAERRAHIETMFDSLGDLKAKVAQQYKDKQAVLALRAHEKQQRVARQLKEKEHEKRVRAEKMKQWLERTKLMDEIKAAGVVERKRIAHQQLIDRHRFRDEHPVLRNVLPGPGSYNIRPEPLSVVKRKVPMDGSVESDGDAPGPAGTRSGGQRGRARARRARPRSSSPSRFKSRGGGSPGVDSQRSLGATSMSIEAAAAHSLSYLRQYASMGVQTRPKTSGSAPDDLSEFSATRGLEVNAPLSPLPVHVGIAGSFSAPSLATASASAPSPPGLPKKRRPKTVKTTAHEGAELQRTVAAANEAKLPTHLTHMAARAKLEAQHDEEAKSGLEPAMSVSERFNKKNRLGAFGEGKVPMAESLDSLFPLDSAGASAVVSSSVSGRVAAAAAAQSKERARSRSPARSATRRSPTKSKSASRSKAPATGPAGKTKARPPPQPSHAPKLSGGFGSAAMPLPPKAKGDAAIREANIRGQVGVPHVGHRRTMFDFHVRASAGVPGPGTHKLPAYATSPVAKWGEQEPLSDIEWQILRASRLPGPGEYRPKAPQAKGGGRFNMSNSKSEFEWIEYNARQLPSSADYGDTTTPRPVRSLARLQRAIGPL